MRRPEICSCLPIGTLTAARQVAEVDGTHRIRVNSGAFGRAALAGAGAASPSRPAAAGIVRRPFTTGCQQPRQSEVPALPLPFTGMSWRRNRMERPPRVGAAVLAKALAGVFTVFLATTAGVAGAGYFQIQPPAPKKGEPPPEPDLVIPEPELPEVEPGGPRTLLV